MDANNSSFDDVVAESPVFGVLRRCSMAQIECAADAVSGSPVRLVEVTTDTAGWQDQIALLREKLPSCFVGAGSVLDDKNCSTAIRAGAQFVVSPITDPSVVRTCKDHGVPAIPGAATPSEIAAAVGLGAGLVKVFPISLLGGTQYLDAVLAPLYNPAVLVSGGIDLTNAPAYLRHGARAVAVGGALWEPHLTGLDPEGLRSALARWVMRRVEPTPEER